MIASEITTIEGSQVVAVVRVKREIDVDWIQSESYKCPGPRWFMCNTLGYITRPDL